MAGREAPVHRRLAAPGVGAVHEVVVDQRAGLHQLQGGDGRDHSVRVGAAGSPVAPVRERGPQPLAAPEHEVFDGVGDRQQCLVDGRQPGPPHPEELGERLVDPGPQVGAVERRR
ncbi:hypothetical protein Prum_022990 [Phytohabitans rumicis]|uniref:Uncharacterized protein n=1 Tax=Phytohabitans rumicis TaxID=1076125 RepID=A0A6V8L3K4_9ACTN|nr:hypothetical protein Prum_022990 [Phytohabitans rumicis]